MSDANRGAVPGALVLSLDFELHWGVRDRQDARGPYARNLHGARTVIPRLLSLFEEFDVAATWATVGFLFAGNRADLDRFAPAALPSYRDAALSPYHEAVGDNEDTDPLHFGRRLVLRIRNTPRQEVATHTFSHYYCGERGQTADEFRADLAAARAIARRDGIKLTSIVFPRNQHNPAYDEILREAGVRTYRGNPGSSLWRFEDARGSSRVWRRAGRFFDGYVRVVDDLLEWDHVLQPSGLSDVRASMMLAPYRKGTAPAEPLRLARIRRSLRLAARSGRILHLWWHPHNFGTRQERNIGFLRDVLAEFAICRERHGMLSLTMAEIDERARALHGATSVSSGVVGQ